ncbi:MAG: YkgJ family cysteine cluster protein [Myxococcaceae bacterium]
MSVSALCQLCGLCCDGSLFAFVSLSPDEAAALIERDVAVGMREDGSYRLPQKCSALDGTRCTVYEARPNGCRVYNCQLATALSQNEVSLDEATATVREAQERIAALNRELPVGASKQDRPVSTLNQEPPPAASVIAEPPAIVSPDRDVPPPELPAIQRVRRSHAGEEPALSDAAQLAWERARDFLRRHFTGRHGLS